MVSQCPDLQLETTDNVEPMSFWRRHSSSKTSVLIHLQSIFKDFHSNWKFENLGSKANVHNIGEIQQKFMKSKILRGKLSECPPILNETSPSHNGLVRNGSRKTRDVSSHDDVSISQTKFRIFDCGVWFETISTVLPSIFSHFFSLVVRPVCSHRCAKFAYLHPTLIQRYKTNPKSVRWLSLRWLAISFFVVWPFSTEIWIK